MVKYCPIKDADATKEAILESYIGLREKPSIQTIGYLYFLQVMA